MKTLQRKPAPRRTRRAKPGVPAPFPQTAGLMLCTLVAEPFNHPDWIFEPKYDGVRILALFNGDRLTVLSRNNEEQSRQFPDIAEALGKTVKQSAIVDGEVVCFDERGESSFRALQQRFHIQDPLKVRARMRLYPAYVYLFDILYFHGYDLRNEPLHVRKEMLRGAVQWSERVRWTEFTPQEGTRLWREACRHGREGVIGKQRQSRYVAGRSSSWVKIKCLGRQEFVIAGFTEPQRSRIGLGALLVGYYSDDGERLIYAGKVGTGYTNDVLRDLRQRLDKLARPDSPFDGGTPPRGAGVHWVQPRLVAEIAFGEWTQNGLLRQPRFEGLRPDKKPRECRREEPARRRR